MDQFNKDLSDMSEPVIQHREIDCPYCHNHIRFPIPPEMMDWRKEYFGLHDKMFELLTVWSKTNEAELTKELFFKELEILKLKMGEGE